MPGFGQLGSDVLERIAGSSQVTEVGYGDEVFKEGTLPESLYVLLDGKVSLTGTASDASRTVIDILGPSSSFVLANVLTNEPYLMGAQAIESARLVQVAAEPVRQLVAEQPAIAMAMMRAMSAELANMTRQVVDLKVRIAAQRLGTYLLSLVREPAATQADFRLPVTKGLLAPWLGCRAENLSRAFMALRAYGVETHGSRVVLHDISSLRAYAGAIDPQPVEKVFGDAFRIRPRRTRVA